MNLHSTHFSHALQDCHARDYGLNTAKLEQLFLAYGAPEEEGDDEIVLNVRQFEAMLHEAGIMQARPLQQNRSSIPILTPYWYHLESAALGSPHLIVVPSTSTSGPLCPLSRALSQHVGKFLVNRRRSLNSGATSAVSRLLNVSCRVLTAFTVARLWAIR